MKTFSIRESARQRQFGDTNTKTEFRPNLTNLAEALGEHSSFIAREFQAGVSALDTV